MNFFNKATFFRSSFSSADFPRSRFPQIAFVGRSNVGKSSLINAVLNRKNLAKTSKTPGKTRSINFYEIDGKYYFVDLPGYGFAKIAKSEQAKWRWLIEDYFRVAENLKGVAHLIDIRIGPLDSDKALIDYVKQFGHKLLFVLTKADQLPMSKTQETVRNIQRELDTNTENLVIFSARDGTGVQELQRRILELLKS